ncbi:MAG: hypothetical protein AB1393_09740 [Candidatus Edwardsbacteria bacterium]
MDSSFVWTVPDSSSDSCLIKVIAYSPPGFLWDESDGVFKISAVGVEETSVHSSKFIVHSKLYQNQPNPFTESTEIRYQIADNRLQMTDKPSSVISHQSSVSLKIYNVAGQLVKTLVNEVTPPFPPLTPTSPSPQGEGRVRSVVWDGRDESGKPVAPGVYFYRLKAGDFTDTKKMVLSR